MPDHLVPRAPLLRRQLDRLLRPWTTLVARRGSAAAEVASTVGDAVAVRQALLPVAKLDLDGPRLLVRVEGREPVAIRRTAAAAGAAVGTAVGKGQRTLERKLVVRPFAAEAKGLI